MTDYKRMAEVLRGIAPSSAANIVLHGGEARSGKSSGSERLLTECAALVQAARLCEREALVEALLAAVAEAVEAGDCWETIADAADRVREYPA